MMLVLVAVGAVLVLAIAAVAIGRAVAQTAAIEPPAVVEVEELVEFVADALPSETTAQVSYDDVKRVVRLYFDYVHKKEVEAEEDELLPDATVVLDEEEAVADIRRRAELRDLAVSEDHVRDILTAVLAYFEAVGAVGEEADLDDLEPGSPHLDRP